MYSMYENETGFLESISDHVKVRSLEGLTSKVMNIKVVVIDQDHDFYCQNTYM